MTLGIRWPGAPPPEKKEPSWAELVEYAEARLAEGCDNIELTKEVRFLGNVCLRNAFEVVNAARARKGMPLWDLLTPRHR